MSDRAKKLAESLARAREAASMLEEETEGVNAVIARAESMLADLRMGVTASVKLWDEDSDGEFTYLGFGKVDKQWRLTIETGYDPSEVEVSPLANASREARLAAIELLPELVDALIKQTEHEVVEVAKTKAKGDAFLDDLGAALTMSTASPNERLVVDQGVVLNDPRSARMEEVKRQRAAQSDVVNPLPTLPPLTTKNKPTPSATGAPIRGARIVEVPTTTKKPGGGK